MTNSVRSFGAEKHSAPQDVSTRPLRVGVVGYGYWGSKHVRVLAGIPNVEVAVIENRPQRLREVASSFPAVRLASSVEEVADDLDAVVVATPPCSHALVAKQALQAGLHALVEKPLATSVAEAQSLVDAADSSGLSLMVGHTFEYNAAVWKLKQLIRSEEFGRILYIHTARLSLGRYQNDCNVIWDLAPHDISIVSYLLDEYPEVAAAWAQRNVGELHADVAYLKLNFPRASVPAFIHVSWLDPSKVRRVTVVGERQMAVYDDLAAEERIRIYDAGVTPTQLGEEPAPFEMPVTYRTGDITSPYIEFPEPLMIQDSHFVDCVRNGGKPDTDGHRGLQIVKVLEATDEVILRGAGDGIESAVHQRIPALAAKSEVAS